MNTRSKQKKARFHESFSEQLKYELENGFKRGPGIVSVLQCDNINDLPNAILITIIAKLPVIDLFRVSFVCSRWNVLRQAVCEQKTSLALYSPFATEYSDTRRNNNYRLKLDLLRFFRLDYHRFDLITEIKPEYLNKSTWDAAAAAARKLPLVCRDQAVQKLPQKLPNIRQVIVFDCALSANEIIHMLTAWKDTLVTFCLVVTQSHFDWPKMYKALNELHALENLSLYCFEGPALLSDNLPVDLMPRLKTFYFAYWDYYFTSTQTYLFRAWDHLDVQKVESFGFGIFSAHTHSSPFVRYNLKRLLVKKAALATKLTRVKLPKMSRTFLQYLCRNFPSITHLDMELHHLKSDLVPLENVKQLKYLGIRSNGRPYSDSPLKNIRGTEEELQNLPLLDTVQHLLVLDFDIRTEVLHFIFPNAKVQFKIRGDQNEVDYLEEPNHTGWQGQNILDMNSDINRIIRGQIEN